ncbi:MAG: FmdB family zinc ribbon protein [Verrucomicrobiales bacterium]
MPTYEYACPKCEKTFEIFQSMKDKPLTKCPDKPCRGRVKRLLGTGAGLIFKGSGFYITDYRSEGYKSAAKSESSTSTAATPTSSGESGGSPAKSEAKPAAQTEGGKKEATKPKKAAS